MTERFTTWRLRVQKDEDPEEPAKPWVVSISHRPDVPWAVARRSVAVESWDKAVKQAFEQARCLVEMGFGRGGA